LDFYQLKEIFLEEWDHEPLVLCEHDLRDEFESPQFFVYRSDVHRVIDLDQCLLIQFSSKLIVLMIFETASEAKEALA
jgi:hypothetical protein